MLDVSGIVTHLKNVNKISLGITFGENGSDITYGWNGGMAGYSLYHYHFTNIIEGKIVKFLFGKSPQKR